MFKTIGFNGFGFSKALVVAAATVALAASSFGFSGHAEARINGDPVGSLAQQCKLLQDGYDRWVANFYAAGTPEELLEARSWVNVYMQAWKDMGCELAYGDVRFIVAGGGSTYPTLTANPTTTPAAGSLKVSGPAMTSTRTR